MMAVDDGLDNGQPESVAGRPGVPRRVPSVFDVDDHHTVETGDAEPHPTVLRRSLAGVLKQVGERPRQENGIADHPCPPLDHELDRCCRTRSEKCCRGSTELDEVHENRCGGLHEVRQQGGKALPFTAGLRESSLTFGCEPSLPVHPLDESYDSRD